MKLASLLSPKQVILDLHGEVCADALANIVDHLVARGVVAAGLRDEVLELLEQRERQVSTGIGSGVAIPHAFCDSIDHVVAAFARSSEGIDFEAIDNAPVHFVMLFVVPKKEYNLHLQTLAAVARMFHNCDVRRQLQEAGTVEQVLAVFESHSPAIRAGS
jgi:mannitol/fructose-specific phosphotransferase system IIA component (Ntr-type)